MALMNTYTRWPIAPVKGEGTRLWDAEGRSYLDFTAGIGVVNIGHNHPQVAERLKRQLHKLWHVSNLFTIPAQEALAERLTAASGCDAAFFCNSGAEANEAAIKLARKAAHEKKGITYPELITFNQSFHGRTLATLTATGQDKVKSGFGPLPTGFVTVEWEDIDALKRALSSATIGVMLEVVQGEGGVRPARKAWLKEVERLCREHDILLIVDEVQTGMGRTGTLFAFEAYGIEPDIITLAKGLGNGFPLGCLLAKADVAAHFGAGSHGSTFGGNPLAMEAGLGVLDVLEQPGFLDEVKAKGDMLHSMLKDRVLTSARTRVKDVRGRGLMAGIVLDEPQAAACVTAAQAKGLLVLPAGDEVIRLLPPLTVTEAEIAEAVDVLADVCAQAQAGAPE